MHRTDFNIANYTITNLCNYVKFDDDEDIGAYLDFSTAVRLKDFNTLKTDTKKVNVDFPEWVINALDEEAKRIAVTRQSIIKVLTYVIHGGYKLAKKLKDVTLKDVIMIVKIDALSDMPLSELKNYQETANQTLNYSI